MLLLLSSLALADDAHYTLIRRDAKLCDAAKDTATCVQLGSLAEPSSSWRDPWRGTVVEEQADWVYVEGAFSRGSECWMAPPFPAGYVLRVWVRRTDLVPATARPLSWDNGETSLYVATGLPVGTPYQGQQGIAAAPFLGTAAVPGDATTTIWSPMPPSKAMPEGAKKLTINYGIHLNLGGATGTGTLLPPSLMGVEDTAKATLTVGSECMVTTFPMSLATAAELRPADAAATAAAAAAPTGTAIPAGSPVFWSNGKPAGVTEAGLVIDPASVTTKGKLSCTEAQLPKLKRTVTMCVSKDLVAAPK